MENNDKTKFMLLALNQAKKCLRHKEVPVGAVIVKNGKVISYGRNKREKGKNSLYHAELIAINRACKKLGGWRLSDCEMYVTLEPCPMCAGAIINSRIKKIYIGTDDKKGGAVLSVCNMFELPFNHKPELEYFILKDQCSQILSDFFKSLRQNKKQ